MARRANVSRVLITDSTYKHSIALARYLKREMPDLHLVGCSIQGRPVPDWYGCFDETIRRTSVEEVLAKQSFDMVIPVGGLGVLAVARLCPELAVLPSLEQIEICYDKPRTLALAKQLSVPAPESFFIASPEAEIPEPTSFPCVVKPSREATSWKSVDYCNTYEELKRAVPNQLHHLRNDPGAGVLIQEYIPGKGHGFFALMDRGVPLRVFMHERLRENPPTGGVSCAARSHYSARMEELGLKLLSALKWTGVAMVEFKLDPRTGDFVLMEINGKFWGSLELALSAGVNFGADLVRLYRGENLQYSNEYRRELQFYWPLDGDLETLIRTRSLGSIRDYWQRGAECCVGQSLRADLFKTAALVKHLLAR